VEEPQDERDLAARQSDIADAMEETERRQQALRERQDKLLERLQQLDAALDRDKPGEG
jgi:hypothetical protein